MKYIIFEKSVGDTKVKIPIVFPNSLVHLEVAKALKNVVGSGRIVGAGDVVIRAVSCSGESTTIGIKSKAGDRELINSYDYTYGLEDAMQLDYSFISDETLKEIFKSTKKDK